MHWSSASEQPSTLVVEVLIERLITMQFTHQGPTEIDAHSQVDMNLSDADIADLTNEWLTTLTDAQVRIRGPFTIL